MTPHPPDLEQALARCAQERIEIPGAVQPHGCLLAFEPSTLLVIQASANSEAFVGETVDALLGRPVTCWMTTAGRDDLERALSSFGDDTNRLISFDGPGDGLVGTVHRENDLALLELEYALPERDARNHIETSNALKQIAAAKDLPALAATVVGVVRDLLKFDRVVVYRFMPDGSGEVIAESRSAEMEPYLGLRFPESDIPRQARDLYLRNWVRAIPDAQYEPSPIVPELRPATGAPLDLSQAALRSVSPMHLAYLANMGVRASLSASLIVNGRLWGLITCGHRSASQLPPAIRNTCETLARMVSTQISALEAREIQRRHASNIPAMRLLDKAMRGGERHVFHALLDDPSSLLRLVNASGAAVVVDGAVTSAAACPSPGEIRSLAAWASGCADDVGLTRCHHLASVNEAWRTCADVASGLLAIVFPPPLQACLLWFRPELIRHVQWAGRPAFSPPVHGGAAVLGPHRSFAVWSDTVQGQCDLWNEADEDAASDLRQLALEIDLGRQVRRQKEAVQARDDLVAVVSHDLRTPMSIVAMQATIIQRVVAADPTDTSQRLRASAQTIQRATDRMNSLLQDLLDLAKIEAGRFQVQPSTQSAHHILDDACGLLVSIAEAKGVELVPEPSRDAQIHVDPERIFQVLANLIGNAVKFSSPGTRVSVGGTVHDDGYQFRVVDQGIGIAREQLDRIFERYWQAKQSAGAGAGLGLYISKGIVEAHGGAMSVESEPGQGATFLFTVPLA